MRIEGRHLALERAYLAYRAQGGGEWVLATLQGRFVMREPKPGLPPRERCWWSKASTACGRAKPALPMRRPPRHF